MRTAPPNAGPRTANMQFTGGGEVGQVRSDAPVRLDEVGSLPVVLHPVLAGRMLGLGRTTLPTSGECSRCGVRGDHRMEGES